MAGQRLGRYAMSGEATTGTTPAPLSSQADQEARDDDADQHGWTEAEETRPKSTSDA